MYSFAPFTLHSNLPAKNLFLIGVPSEIPGKLWAAQVHISPYKVHNRALSMVEYTPVGMLSATMCAGHIIPILQEPCACTNRPVLCGN